MPRLPVELLDNIGDLAIALGILTVKDMVLVCHRWKLKYQKLIFKSVKLDPFDDDIPNLGDPDHDHLIPHIEELRVVSRSNSSAPSNRHCDLSPPFTSFLRHATNASSMILGDSRIQWEHVSSDTIDAFCTVFRCRSFRSLDVSVDTPIPSWMLLYGASVASQLTVHSVESIMLPPEMAELVPYQCSITHLMLNGNAAIIPVAKFCLQQRNLAKELLQNVIHLVLEYDQTYASLDPPVTPYAEILLAFLAPQLEELDLRVESSDIPPSHISITALQNLKALQRFSIHLSACTIGYGDTLRSAQQYMASVFSSLPHSSPIRSLSLKVTDRRVINPGCRPKIHNLLKCFYQHLSCPENWPRLTSIDILVNVNDGNVTKPIEKDGSKQLRAGALRFISLFQVNVRKAR